MLTAAALLGLNFVGLKDNGHFTYGWPISNKTLFQGKVLWQPLGFFFNIVILMTSIPLSIVFWESFLKRKDNPCRYWSLMAFIAQFLLAYVGLMIWDLAFRNAPPNRYFSANDGPLNGFVVCLFVFCITGSISVVLGLKARTPQDKCSWIIPNYFILVPAWLLAILLSIALGWFGP